MAHITDDIGNLDIGPASEEALQKAIDAGDLNAINELLEAAQNPGEPTESKTGEESAASGEQDSKKSEDQTETKTETAEANADAEGEAKPVVLTKDGKRQIPYEVLESARAKASQLADENQALKDKLAEHESKSQTVTKFLAAKGIDLNSITDADAEGLSDEELAQLDDLDPVVGKAIRLLSKNVAQAKGNQDPDPEPAKVDENDPPHVAFIKKHPDLSKWLESDIDRWEFAADVDERLQKDPKFKDVPFQDRFAEVVRRTKIAFGDEVQPAPNKNSSEKIEEIANKKIEKALADSVPRSLSNIGITPESERSPLELLADKDPHELVDAMSKMSPDKLMETLSNIQY